MRRPAWVLAAAPRRATAEAGLLVFAMTLPMAALFASAPETNPGSDAIMWGAVGATLFVSPFAACRRRRATGRRQQRIRRELGESAATLGAIGGGIVSAAAAGPVVAAWRGWTEGGALELVVFSAGMAVPAVAPAAAAYSFWRGVVLAWPSWDRRRRTRLFWALTHAQLVASLALTVSVAAVLTGFALVSLTSESVPNASSSDADDIVTALARWTQQAVPATLVFFLVSLVVGTVIVPPVALISARVLRRATRRLDDLAAATGALRAGDLAARVCVGGEDEVGRLQTDFNAMAADLERTLRELEAERDEVARLLAERRQLVAAVSHELRTPVATLRGYLDSSLERWDEAPPSTLRGDLGVMAAETERLGRLIDDLFTLARVEVGRLPIAPRPTDLGALLRRAASAVAPLAWERGKVEVLTETPRALPPALVDPDRLEQIVRNLLANAVRHNPPGGLVLLSAAAHGDELLVQVKDTGEGIAPADLPLVWDRFYRSDGARDRDRGGAGLGLALVKELTEAMGGTVDVESIAGEGACFTLRLPAAPTPSNP